MILCLELDQMKNQIEELVSEDIVHHSIGVAEDFTAVAEV